jgi:hypothetical protein
VVHAAQGLLATAFHLYTGGRPGRRFQVMLAVLLQFQRDLLKALVECK